MKEIRLTVKADDFGAISQILVDQGVGFRVEPIVAAEPDVAPKRSAPPKTKTAKPAKKSGRRSAKRSTKSEDMLGTGADRLREAIARTSATTPGTTSIEPSYTNPAVGGTAPTSPGEGGT